MAAFRSAVVDGRTVLIPDDPPAAPKNPPLAALNASYREADRERRDETEDTVEAASKALRNALCGPAVVARRTQKALRPVARS